MFLLKYIYGQTQSEEANILHSKAEAGPHCYLSPRGSGQLRSLGRLLTAQHPRGFQQTAGLLRERRVPQAF